MYVNTPKIIPKPIASPSQKPENVENKIVRAIPDEVKKFK